MPTEFLHCQDDGGGGAALNDFWGTALGAKSQAAASSGIGDEGIARTDFNGHIDVNGVNAPEMGRWVRTGRRRAAFTPSGNILTGQNTVDCFACQLQWKPPPVENRYHFTNLSQCRFSWQLVNYTKPFSGQSGVTILQKGTASSPVVAGHPIGHLVIELASQLEQP